MTLFAWQPLFCSKILSKCCARCWSSKRGVISRLNLCFFNKSWSSGRSPLRKWADKALPALQSWRSKCSLTTSSKQNQKSVTDLPLFCLKAYTMAQSILTGKILRVASRSDFSHFLNCCCSFEACVMGSSKTFWKGLSNHLHGATCGHLLTACKWIIIKQEIQGHELQ